MPLWNRLIPAASMAQVALSAPIALAAGVEETNTSSATMDDPCLPESRGRPRAASQAEFPDGTTGRPSGIRGPGRFSRAIPHPILIESPDFAP